VVAGLLLLNSRTGLIDPKQRTNDYSIGFFVFLTILVVNLQVRGLRLGLLGFWIKGAGWLMINPMLLFTF